MKLWITNDKEGIGLWDIKPTLAEDNIWCGDEFEIISMDTYYILTGNTTLLNNGGILELEINTISNNQNTLDEVYKSKKHK